MIALRKDIRPSQAKLDQLEVFQAAIEEKTTFAEKSAEAKRLFSLRNTKKNPVFKEVKACLSKMCNSTRRCVYCEDSIGDEVEHIFPKDLYPDKCFSWENYVYACGPCNGPKNNMFAVFKQSDGQFIEVNPTRGTSASQPPPGEAALINPRIEDPLEFAILDLSGTFKFYPLPDLDPKNKKRTEYTYYDVLRLNHEEREPLRQARENAFGMFKARLSEYVSMKTKGVHQNKLDKLIDGIKKENHPTVWKEMQRYYNDDLLKKVDPKLEDLKELEKLFDSAPEALTW